MLGCAEEAKTIDEEEEEKEILVLLAWTGDALDRVEEIVWLGTMTGEESLGVRMIEEEAIETSEDEES